MSIINNSPTLQCVLAVKWSTDAVHSCVTNRHAWPIKRQSVESTLAATAP